MIVSYKKYRWLAMGIMAAIVCFIMALAREFTALICCLHPGTSEGSLTVSIVAIAMNFHQIQAVMAFVKDARATHKLHSQFLIQLLANSSAQVLLGLGLPWLIACLINSDTDPVYKLTLPHSLQFGAGLCCVMQGCALILWCVIRLRFAGNPIFSKSVGGALIVCYFILLVCMLVTIARERDQS